MASFMGRRLMGFIALMMGLSALLVGLLAGYALVTRSVGASGEGLMNLAIFFSLLSGLGIVAGVAGFNLLFASRSTRSVQLVPWPFLVASGVLILASMLGFGAYMIWLGQPLAGASAKGVSILLGLGLSLLFSGLYRRRKRTRRMFE